MFVEERLYVWYIDFKFLIPGLDVCCLLSRQHRALHTRVCSSSIVKLFSEPEVQFCTLRKSVNIFVACSLFFATRSAILKRQDTV